MPTMSSQLLDVPLSISSFVIGGAAIIAVARLLQPSKLQAIPTVGSSDWIDSWWAGLRFVINMGDIIREGCVKHKSTPFKVAQLDSWLVVFGSHRDAEELQAAPDNVLSSSEAVHDLLQIEHTMGSNVRHNSYHIPIVRSRLTRNIGALYADIRNEITTAFDDLLDLEGNEWRSVPALSLVQNIVCRASNRVFLGLPMCRDPDWVDLNIQYTLAVVKGGSIIRLFPEFLKPVATRLFTTIGESKERARKLLRPIIEERRRYINECGDDWEDKPNDFLSWLMEEAKGPEATVELLTTRLLALNFASIHTTANSFIQALFCLAANPQYIKPLREEVEPIIEKDGWSKASLGRMRKVDSFLKECQRFKGVSIFGMRRKALKDYTFSNGTSVPKGTTIVLALPSIHFDESLYRNAHAFEPFRHIDLAEADEGSGKHHFVSTTADYMPFGYGRHACPGRFFAACEMKTMLAHIVMAYDIKLEDNATHPQSLQFGTVVVSNPNARVVFRRRLN